MNRDLLDQLRQENPEALLADGFEDAFVGIARRCGQPALAVYSVSKALAVLVEQGLDGHEAVEHLEFNVLGAWMGPHTPIWLSDDDRI